MKILIMLTMLLSLVSCGDSCGGKYGDSIRSLTLEQRNTELLGIIDDLKRELSIKGYCPQYIPPICQENKILTGCLAFRQHLISNGTPMVESAWKFCEKYNSK